MKAINGLFFTLLLWPVSLAAQNSMTASPYSMFGLGEMAAGLYGQQVAMGGAVYGMRDAMGLNRENPAALTALDSCRLIAEASAFGRYETYRSGGDSHRAFVGNVSAFAIGARICPGWYMAASLTPYSMMGYYFKSEQPLEGSPSESYTSTFQGSGGLSKASLSQAFRLPAGFSVGVNLSYVFGNLKQTETQSALTVVQEMFVGSLYADFGLQYTRRIRRELEVVLGAVYGYRQRLSLENTFTITGSTTSDEWKKKRETQYLPQYVGVGGAAVYKKMTYALDYTFRQQRVLSSGDSRFRFRNTHECRAGAAWKPGGYPSGNYWERVSYEAGVLVANPALSVENRGGIHWRISAGLGLPVSNGRIQAALFYDRLRLPRGALQRSLTGLTLTYTIGEWMHKVKL